MSNSLTQNPPNKLTKRHLRLAALIVVAISVIALLVNGPLAGFFASWSAADEEPGDSINPLPVNVAEVRWVDSIEQTHWYTGTIRARHRSDLGFELGGRIKTVLVDEGAEVSKGQVLAELDTETLKAQETAILAQLTQSQSLLEELNRGPRLEKIKAAQAAVAAANSQFKNASLSLNRRQRLFDVGAISTEEFDQARYSEKTAEANLHAAQQQLSELESGTRQERLAGQRAAVKRLEAAAQEVAVALSKSLLRAPFAGNVTRRYLDPGSIAPASVPVVKLVEQQHLEAWIGLPVAHAAELKLETQFDIRVAGKTYSATASAKILELDPITRTQTVLFDLEPEASADVVSGQLCEIPISNSVDSSGFWIPTSALVKGIRGLWSVFVIVPSETGDHFCVQTREINIVETDSGRVLVEGSLTAGDRIVVDGVHRVGAGQLVVPSDE